MFLQVPTPEEISLWDKNAIHIGIPELILMENASREALHVLQETFGYIKNKRILTIMGSGNNGGDAVCLARHLHDAGAKVLVLHSRALTNYRGITGQYLRLAKHCGVSFLLANSWLTKYHKSPWYPSDIIIDGLIGIGLSSELKELECNLINHINIFSEKSFVLALDIPSGLSSLTGKPQPIAIKATVTVTFEAAKPGLLLPEASNYVGKLYIRSIGIPSLARKKNPSLYQTLNPYKPLPLPISESTWHKGNAGHILILGGVANAQKILTGAPYLTALSALRTGAGLVTIAAPYDLCSEIKANCPDIMMHPLGKPGTTCWSPQLLQNLLPELPSYKAIVLGPGMGKEPETSQFIRAFLTIPNRVPTVIDADALIALLNHPEIFSILRDRDILTPHPGEAAYLLKTSSSCIQMDRFTAIKKLTLLSPATWILKGAGTLIASPGEPTMIIPQTSPNLAVGGSGDVLAGCLGTLLAQNIPPYLAACLAVRLHIEAGLILAKRFPTRGNTASEIAHTIPEAYTKLTQISSQKMHQHLGSL